MTRTVGVGAFDKVRIVVTGQLRFPSNGGTIAVTPLQHYTRQGTYVLPLPFTCCCYCHCYCYIIALTMLCISMANLHGIIIITTTTTTTTTITNIVITISCVLSYGKCAPVESVHLFHVSFCVVRSHIASVCFSFLHRGPFSEHKTWKRPSQT